MEARKVLPVWIRFSLLSLLVLIFIGCLVGVFTFLSSVIDLVSGPVGQPQEGVLFQFALIVKTVFIWAWKYPLAAILIIIIMIVAALGPGKKPSQISGLH